MDFCNKCGSKTDPDWVFCRSCGNSLDDGDPAAGESAQSTPIPTVPKVELISRGWDVVDVETFEIEAIEVTTVDVPGDPLTDDDVVPAIAPGSVEISVEDVTIVEHGGDDAEQGEEEAPLQQATGTAPDAWDHLRPHGQLPGIKEPSRTPARVTQSLAAVASLAALVSAVLYVILNVQLDRYSQGRVSEETVFDIRDVAEASLLLLAALTVLALISLGWWMMKAHASSRFKPGRAGRIALIAFVGGSALITFFSLQDSATVSADLAANTLVVLGLGLITVAGLVAIGAIGRIENRVRW